MPLTELMNYFNDQLKVQSPTDILPKSAFFKSNGAYMARFGNLVMGSKFYPIHYAATKDVFAYESELLVRSAAGNLLNIDHIFNSLDSHEQIVQLDRLVRTLHSINYLQKIDGSETLLALPVQPRHIVSVVDGHGKAFENILSDCGLGPERVLLHTRLLDDLTLNHFSKALSNYRNRNYKIGISITQPQELDLLAQLDLEPDVIFIQDVVIHGEQKSKSLDLLSFYKSALINVNSIETDQPLDAIFQGKLVKPEAITDLAVANFSIGNLLGTRSGKRFLLILFR